MNDNIPSFQLDVLFTERSHHIVFALLIKFYVEKDLTNILNMIVFYTLN